MPTTIWVVFLGKPKGVEGWPYKEFDCEERKGYLLKRLKERCREIEFVGRDIIFKSEEVEEIKERIKEFKQEVDGVLLYTLASYSSIPSPEKILKLGYPTIIASDLFGGDMPFLQTFDLSKKKQFHAIPVCSSKLEDITRALHLMEVIHKLKRGKILIIEDSKEYDDQSHFWRREYEDYLKEVKKLGIEVIILGSESLNEYYRKADERKAKEVAKRWISEAAQVMEPSKSEIIKSARLYLAIKSLMKELKADAITIDCLGLFYRKKLLAYPCLAFFQLNNEGSLGVCEADLEATLSQLIGQYLTQRVGFVSDPVIDSSSSQIVYVHCVAPSKPFGKDGQAFPYRIRSHAEDGKGASVQVFLPPGEILTTIKVNLLAKKLAIHQARSVGNIEDERACRTKLAAEAEVEKVLRNWDYQIFGWHRVTFYGDFREDFRNLATLLGLTVLEEDK
jgi:L-fucose isomerase-like protein